MTIQTRSQQKSAPSIHLIVAGAIAAAAVATAVFLNTNQSDRTAGERSGFAPSISVEQSQMKTLADELALDEALTEASFDPLTGSGSAEARAAIEQHSAHFPAWPLLPSAGVVANADEAARAIEQHGSYFPKASSESGLSAEALAGIREHDALIEALVS